MIQDEISGKRFIEVIDEYLENEAQENSLSTHTRLMHEGHLANALRFLCDN